MPPTRRKPAKPILSPTRIATYLECAVKYRYVYIDKVGRYFLKGGPHQSLGSTLHRVLESFHREGARASAAQIEGRLNDGWIHAGYESTAQEAEFRAAGSEMVLAYHAAAATRAESGIETLFTEKTIRTDMGLFILRGRVDRIDRHPDDTLEVIDYKSGRSQTSPEEVAKDLTMNIYQLILRRIYPYARVIGTIHCLRSGIRASAAMSDEDAARFADDMRVLGEGIISRDYEALEPVRIAACEDCEFLLKCGRFWQYQARREMIVE